MLSSFSARRYRLFKSLRVLELGRVNLLVGRNNAGKSAFLEALELYAGAAAPRVLFNLVSAREETWHGRVQTEFRQLHGNPIRHLFYGHRLPEVGEPGIELGPVDSLSETLGLFTAAFQVVADEEGVLQRTRVNPDNVKSIPEDVEITLMAQEGDKLRRVMRVNRDADFVRRIGALADPEAKLPVQVVPTRNMLPSKVASLWDVVGLTDLAEEVVEGLRLIEPLVQDIAFVEGSVSAREARVPLVRIKGGSEPLPLRSLGDGMTRLFQIVLALVNARDGVLLVDEFENGLHWSVQPAAWKTVFRLATKLNVQVFASTHSRDCVAGFEKAWNDRPADGNFLRLDPDPDFGVKTRQYSLETLADSLETAVEVR